MKGRLKGRLKGHSWGMLAVMIAAAMLSSVSMLAITGLLPRNVIGASRAYAQGEYVEPLPEQESPFAQVVERVMPCVVGVSNKTTAFSMYTGRTESIEQASGSGVVITTQGHVVTNYHVIENAKEIQILHQGELIDAKLIGYDELTDLAVLQAMEGNLPAATMGDPDSVRAGDWAIVIGNPLGQQFADTVTVGVISAVGREIEGSIVKMLQTDAAINSGNSGGALFNIRGQLIGIPSMKYTSYGFGATIEGIGMAIPMDVVKPIVEQIIKYGQVTRPKMGVTISTVRGTDELTSGALPAGVLIQAVTAGGPADEAGIEPYDIITHIDGERVTQHSDLSAVVNSHAVGDTVVLTVYRVPGLETLTIQEEIPDGEILEMTVLLKAPHGGSAAAPHGGRAIAAAQAFEDDCFGA